MNDNKKWALITTYKVLEPPEINFQFMETFINFYRKKWNVEKEILLIGVPENLIEKNPKILQPILKRLKALGAFDDGVREELIELPVNLTIHTQAYLKNISYFTSAKTDFILYRTNHSTSLSQWNIIKKLLFEICNQKLDASYNRVLNIDNDEFLFLDSDREPKDKEHFHFVDYVPPNSGESFDSNLPFQWCLQPWYCRSQFFSSQEKEQNVHKISHGWCKSFAFKRSEIFNPWRHHGSEFDDDVCKHVDQISNNEDNFLDEFHNTNRCYHLSVLDEEHYIRGKALNYQESQTDDTYQQKINKLIENYENFYSKESLMNQTKDQNFRYKTFYDDTLKKYWVNK